MSTTKPSRSSEPYERRIVAFNYASDHENRIHDDDVAQQYGFRGGLVPGVGDYAYLARAAQSVLGNEWLDQGTMEAKFIRPVYHGDTVTARAVPGDDADTCTLELLDSSNQVCAVGTASTFPSSVSGDTVWFDPEAMPRIPLPIPDQRVPARLEALPPGTEFGTLHYDSNSTTGAFAKAFEQFVEEKDRTGTGIERLHPAFIPEVGNQILIQNTKLGPWIHTQSRVLHCGALRPGSELEVRGRVSNSWAKKNREFVELEIGVFEELDCLAQLVHTAIVHLPNRDR